MNITETHVWLVGAETCTLLYSFGCKLSIYENLNRYEIRLNLPIFYLFYLPDVLSPIPQLPDIQFYIFFRCKLLIYAVFHLFTPCRHPLPKHGPAKVVNFWYVHVMSKLHSNFQLRTNKIVLYSPFIFFCS